MFGMPTIIVVEMLFCEGKETRATLFAKRRRTARLENKETRIERKRYSTMGKRAERKSFSAIYYTRQGNLQYLFWLQHGTRKRCSVALWVYFAGLL